MFSLPHVPRILPVCGVVVAVFAAATTAVAAAAAEGDQTCTAGVAYREAAELCAAEAGVVGYLESEAELATYASMHGVPEDQPAWTSLVRMADPVGPVWALPDGEHASVEKWIPSEELLRGVPVGSRVAVLNKTLVGAPATAAPCCDFSTAVSYEAAADSRRAANVQALPLADVNNKQFRTTLTAFASGNDAIVGEPKPVVLHKYLQMKEGGFYPLAFQLEVSLFAYPGWCGSSSYSRLSLKLDSNCKRVASGPQNGEFLDGEDITMFVRFRIPDPHSINTSLPVLTTGNLEVLVDYDDSEEPVQIIVKDPFSANVTTNWTRDAWVDPTRTVDLFVTLDRSTLPGNTVLKVYDLVKGYETSANVPPTFGVPAGAQDAFAIEDHAEVSKVLLWRRLLSAEEKDIVKARASTGVQSSFEEPYREKATDQEFEVDNLLQFGQGFSLPTTDLSAVDFTDVVAQEVSRLTALSASVCHTEAANAVEGKNDDWDTAAPCAKPNPGPPKYGILTGPKDAAFTFDKPTHVYRVIITHAASDTDCLTSVTLSTGAQRKTIPPFSTAVSVATSTFSPTTFAVDQILLSLKPAPACKIKSIVVEGHTHGTATDKGEQGLLFWLKLTDTTLLSDESANHIVPTTPPSPLPTPDSAAHPRYGEKCLQVVKASGGIALSALPAAATETNTVTTCMSLKLTGSGNGTALEVTYDTVYRLVAANDAPITFIVGTDKLVAKSKLVVNTWVYVCAVVDKEWLLLYVDGDSTPTRVLRTTTAFFAGSPTVAIGADLDAAVCDVSMYSKALEAEAIRAMHTDWTAKKSRVELGRLWTPAGTRKAESSLLVGGVPRSWCETDAGKMTCGAQGSDSGKWHLKAKHGGYYSVSFHAKDAQTPDLRLNTDAAVTFAVWLNGHKTELNPARVAQLSFGAGWNTIVLRVTNTAAASREFTVFVTPRSAPLRWSYVADLQGWPADTSAKADISSQCGGNVAKDTKSDMGAEWVGALSYTHTCLATFVAATVLPGSPPTTVSAEHTSQFKVRALIGNFNVSGVAQTYMRDRYELEIKVFDTADKPLSTDVDFTIAVVQPAPFDWATHLGADSSGMNVATSNGTAKDGSFVWSVYFLKPVNVTLSISTLGLPKAVTHDVSALLHPCTPGWCGDLKTREEANTWVRCEPENGCLCSQDVEQSGYWDPQKKCNECLPGYAGSRCFDLCPGVPHQQTCGGHGTCDDGKAGTGFCKCDDNWAAPGCTTCIPRYWGPDCLWKCKDSCTGGCDDGREGTGTCICSEGGDPEKDCKECLPGYAPQGTCDTRCPSACHGNGVCNDAGTVCTCFKDYGGVHCDTPCPGYEKAVEGQKPEKPACGGDTRGTCSKDGSVVRCICKPQFRGDACETCVLGKSGADCNVPCPGMVDLVTDPPLSPALQLPCNGHGTCSSDQPGCTCHPHYSGAACDLLCPSMAGDDGPCSGHGTCANGVCSCTTWQGGGWQDDACQHCSSFSPNECSKVCAKSEACIHAACAAPLTCKCPFGQWGLQGNCQPCACGSDHRRCNPVDGTCDCNLCPCGPLDKECRKKCPIQEYTIAGKTCDKVCGGSSEGCSGHGTCDPVTALCKCTQSVTDGYWGGPRGACEQCDDGWIPWGKCNKKCVHGRGNNVTWLCDCDLGWQGETCSEPTPTCPTEHMTRADKSDPCVCVTGRYELASSCSKICCSGQGKCNDKGEQCQCYADPKLGYWTGTLCDKCLPGYRGERCSTRLHETTHLPGVKCDAPGCPSSGPWGAAPKIHAIDEHSKAVVAGGFPLYFTMNAEAKAPIPVVVPLPAGDCTVTDTHTPLFMHIVEGIAYLFLRCGGAAGQPAVFVCDWTLGSAGHGTPTNCVRHVTSVSSTATFVSGTAWGHVIFLLFREAPGVSLDAPLVILNRGVQSSVTVDTSDLDTSTVQSVAVVGTTLFVGGKGKSGYWEVVPYSLVGWQATTGKIPKMGDTLSVRITRDVETGRLVCGSASNIWKEGALCEPPDFRLAAHMEQATDTSLVVALQGSSSQTALLLVQIDTWEMSAALVLDGEGKHPGSVLDIKVEAEGGQGFASFTREGSGSGRLFRFRLSPFEVLGSITTTPLYSLMVQPSERLLWGLASQTQAELLPLLLWGLDSVTPPVVHTVSNPPNGTVLMITGLSFIVKDGYTPRCEVGGLPGVFSVINKTHATCMAPRGQDCEEEIVSVSLAPQGFVVDPFVKVRRLALPTIKKLVPKMSPNQASERISIEASGLFTTPYTKCKFSYEDGTEAVVPGEVTGGSSKAMVCDSPLAYPVAAALTMDGQTFTNYFHFLGRPSAIHTVDEKLTVSASVRSVLDAIVARVVSSDQLFVGHLDPTVHSLSISSSTISQKCTRIGDPSSCEVVPSWELLEGGLCNGTSVRSSKSVTTTDGAAVFCGLYFAYPQTGIVNITLRDTSAPDGLRPTSVLVQVVHGDAYNLANLTNTKGMNFTERGTLKALSVSVRDVAGNLVTTRIPTTTVRFLSLNETTGEWRAEQKGLVAEVGVADVLLYDSQKRRILCSCPAAPAACDGSWHTYWNAQTNLGTQAGAQVLLQVSGVPVDVAYYSILTHRKSALLTWVIEGSQDQNTWEDLGSPSAEVYDSAVKHPVSRAAGGAPLAFVRVTVRSAAQRKTGTAGEQGQVTFTDLAPAALYHRARYRALVVSHGLNRSYLLSEEMKSAPCHSSKYQVLGTGLCETCPTEAVCDGSDRVVAKEGYWRPNDVTFSFHECELHGNCLGAACAPDSGGRMCAECSPGYHKSRLHGTCEECPDEGVNVPVTAVVLTVIVLALVAVVMSHLFDYKTSVSIFLRIVFDHLQMLAAMAYMQLSFPRDGFLIGFLRSMQAFGLDPDSFRELRCHLKQSDLEFFPYCMAGPLVAVPALLVVWAAHAWWVRKRARTFKGGQLQECRRARSGGEAAWVELEEDMDLDKNPLERASPASMFAMLFVYAVWIFYMGMIARSAALLDCVEVEERPACTNLADRLPVGCVEGGQSAEYLRSDPAVTCSGGRYDVYSLWAGVCLVYYAIGFPLGLLIAMRVYSSWFGEGRTDRTFPAIRGGYRVKAKQWGVLVMVRKASVAVTLTLVRGMSLQAYIILWILTLSLVLHMYVKPYERRFHNSTEGLCLLTLVFTLNLGLLYMNEDLSTGWSVLLEVLLFAANVVALLVLAYLLVSLLRGKTGSRRLDARLRQKVDEESDEDLIELECRKANPPAASFAGGGELDDEVVVPYEALPASPVAAADTGSPLLAGAVPPPPPLLAPTFSSAPGSVATTTSPTFRGGACPEPCTMRRAVAASASAAALPKRASPMKDVRVTTGADFVNVDGKIFRMADVLGVEMDNERLCLQMVTCNLTLHATPPQVSQWGTWVMARSGIRPAPAPKPPKVAEPSFFDGFGEAGEEVASVAGSQRSLRRESSQLETPLLQGGASTSSNPLSSSKLLQRRTSQGSAGTTEKAPSVLE